MEHEGLRGCRLCSQQETFAHFSQDLMERHHKEEMVHETQFMSRGPVGYTVEERT